ncbi:MAG: hypothetical protein LBK71_03950 [Verrucomicrobiales bacterium]|nr:hypothetical protein [Verrucomicrobiales bacterium]
MRPGWPAAVTKHKNIALNNRRAYCSTQRGDVNGLSENRNDGELGKEVEQRPAPASLDGGIAPVTLESARAFIGGSERAISPEQRPDRDTQQLRLVEWARQNHRLFAEDYLAEREPFSEGAESIIYYNPAAHRTIKILRPLVAERTAPLVFFDRMADANRVFGDDLRLVGVKANHDDTHSIVFSQPFYEGEHPDEAIMREILAAHGFFPTVTDGIFENREHGITLYDANPKNFILKLDGQLMPIDVQIRAESTGCGRQLKFGH